MKRFTLPILIALLSLPALAQNVNWNVTLNAVATVTGENYLPITGVTVNGQPLSSVGGVIGPNVYVNSASYGFIQAQIPEDQPWNPSNTWYQWLPTLANTQRGTPTATTAQGVFTETDTFSYEYDLTYFQVWPQVWNGTLVRTLLLHERCGRWPCKVYIPIAQCTYANRCSYSFTDMSDTMVLTGTFPVPTAQ